MELESTARGKGGEVGMQMGINGGIWGRDRGSRILGDESLRSPMKIVGYKGLGVTRGALWVPVH